MVVSWGGGREHFVPESNFEALDSFFTFRPNYRLDLKKFIHS